jgi:hypothetical protein
MARIKSITVKIFPPRDSKEKLYVKTHTAPARRIFLDDGVDDLLKQYADYIEKRWPGVDYKLVNVGPRAYNFVPA